MLYIINGLIGVALSLILQEFGVGISSPLFWYVMAAYFLLIFINTAFHK